MKRFVLTSLCLFILTILGAQTINTFPYSTSFEGIEGNLNYNYPEGWTYEDLNSNSYGNQSWQIIKNSQTSINARTDSTAIHLLGNMTEQNNDWLFTPGIEMTVGNTYTLSFWYNTVDYMGTSEKLKIHICNEANSTEIVEEPLWDNTLTNTVYQNATIEFTPTSSNTYYFGFHCYSDALQYILLLDDISIDESPATSTENYTNYDIQIYPNPSSNEISINIPNSPSKPTSIKLINSQGQIVREVKNWTSQSKLNIQGLEQGIYIVEITLTDTNRVIRKIIID